MIKFIIITNNNDKLYLYIITILTQHTHNDIIIAALIGKEES